MFWDAKPKIDGFDVVDGARSQQQGAIG